MQVIRTALALGALTMSVPVIAQDGRYGLDRSRVERGRDARGGRGEQAGKGRGDSRPDSRPDTRGRVDDRGGRGVGGGSDNRGQPRVEPRVGDRNGGRTDPRAGDRSGGRNDPRGRVPEGRYDPRGGAAGSRYDPRDRRDEPRVAVRPPVIIDPRGRWDGRVEARVGGRLAPYGYRAPYRYGDRDFRHREVLRITTWFRALPPARLSAYGYYGRDWGGVRFAFRPGLYLSMDVFARLEILPFELELELGELPWYLERRIYGNTVLVIDTRSRLVVDMYELDY